MNQLWTSELHIHAYAISEPFDSNVIWRTVLGFEDSLNPRKGGMFNYSPGLCMCQYWVEEG